MPSSQSTRPGPHHRTRYCGLALLLMAGCVGTGTPPGASNPDRPDYQGICLLLMPITVYSDDSRLAAFSAKTLRSASEELAEALTGELYPDCQGDLEQCQAAATLRIHDADPSRRPEHACGPGEAPGVVPQGYNYGQCLSDWGNAMLAQDPALCEQIDTAPLRTLRSFAAGLWIEAYRQEDLTVRSLLIDLPEQTLIETQTAETVNGRLRGRRASRTLRALARVAGVQIAGLLRTAPELQNPTP